MIVILLLIVLAFTLYEMCLHSYYKKDLENEKLIAYFSNTRMQLMKMLYLKEITYNSCYFNFMIRATSYSIRTIYYRKKRLTVQQLEQLEDMLKFLNTEHLKQEFKSLNSEQKELFAKTALKLLELYLNKELLGRLIWGIYLLRISSKILKNIITILEKIVNFIAYKKETKEITYINSLESSYGLSQYAFA